MLKFMNIRQRHDTIVRTGSGNNEIHRRQNRIVRISQLTLHKRYKLAKVSSRWAFPCENEEQILRAITSKQPNISSFSQEQGHIHAVRWRESFEGLIV
jgi:phage repressor protein C with HTH and peptisase S24 domain